MYNIAKNYFLCVVCMCVKFKKIHSNPEEKTGLDSYVAYFNAIYNEINPSPWNNLIMPESFPSNGKGSSSIAHRVPIWSVLLCTSLYIFHLQSLLSVSPLPCTGTFPCLRFSDTVFLSSPVQ